MSQSVRDIPQIDSSGKSKFVKTLKQIYKNRALYLFLLPALIYIAIFNYAPMYGIQIAFRHFVPAKGIFGSPWAGLDYFKRFLNSYHFSDLLKNTIVLSLYQLIASFPFPVILALILNYTPYQKLKKITQTVTYAPHFLSTVVVAGMLYVFLAPGSGIVNVLIRMLGGETVDFLGDKDLFRHIYVWSGIWQNTGWASIIYIAALSGVNPELHEAAIVDGASKLRRMWHIDIPSILPTIIIILILNSGKIMNLGFEKVYLLQ